MGSSLVRVGVRQHARPESISKRAASTTRTRASLRLPAVASDHGPQGIEAAGATGAMRRGNHGKYGMPGKRIAVCY